MNRFLIPALALSVGCSTVKQPDLSLMPPMPQQGSVQSRAMAEPAPRKPTTVTITWQHPAKFMDFNIYSTTNLNDWNFIICTNGRIFTATCDEPMMLFRVRSKDPVTLIEGY